MDWLKRKLAALVRLWKVDIWTDESLRKTNTRGRFHAVLRVISITLGGLQENRAVSRAAALSFSSLIGMGPLIALTVMVAGFALKDNNPDLAVEKINELIRYIAPQIDQYDDATHNGATTAAGGTATAEPAPTIEVRQELVDFINGFVASSRSAAVGTTSAITLIIIVLQLFTSIESAFNDIWGVRRGRAWVARIAYYWTVLTLGAVLLAVALTGLAGGAFANTFEQFLPFHSQLMALWTFFLPLLSFTALVIILAVFYRAIPNTHVNWSAAMVGGLVFGVLLLANNYLAFFSISRVGLTRTLYGSMAIPVILMFGLYIFWFIVLLGGQVSYAIQNARFRNSQAAWNTLAESMRERLSLIVLLDVCRRFFNCQEPPTASQLGTRIGVPDQLLNECLNRLVRMGLLTPIPSPDGQPAIDDRYMPARPLGRTTLAHFKNRDDDLGDDPTGPAINHGEHLLAHYNAAAGALTQSEFFQTPLDELFERFPLTSSGDQLKTDPSVA